MNPVWSMVFSALFPEVVKLVQSLLAQAQAHVDAGNHDAAHATMAAAIGLGQVLVNAGAGIIPNLVHVQPPQAGPGATQPGRA